MTAGVRSTITALNVGRPGLSDAKRTLLLFFCQGHHLAQTGRPLFGEDLYAVDGGVRVDALHESPLQPLSGGELNTIGGVLSRYGNLSPDDLRTLVQASEPWRGAETRGRVDVELLTVWFRRDAETSDPDDGRPTAAQVTAWAARKAATR